MRQEVFEIIEKVHAIFKERDLTLSVAESCTGGLISHYVTILSGASSFFAAGVVSYTEDAKKSILGISSKTIRSYGVVSAEMARKMAEKVRKMTKTDCSVATTGNLGPGVLEGKEKGLVYIAASKKGKTVSHTLNLTGDREANKEEASLSALKLLIKLVEDKTG